MTVRSEISSTVGRKSASSGPAPARLRRLSQGESCTPPEKKASRPAKATPKVNPSPRLTVASAHGSYTPLPSPLAEAADAAARRRRRRTAGARLDVAVVVAAMETDNCFGRLAVGASGATEVVDG